MLACSSACPPYATAKPGPSEACSNRPTTALTSPAGLIPSSMDCSSSFLDMERVCAAIRRLHDSGFYYEGLTLLEAGKLLEPAPVGTFLVRDSADSRYLFSLSVRTERGPTSVRIHYVHSQFRLDAEPSLLDAMPTFDCVLQLVDYYVRLSRTDKSRAHVWLDQEGRRDMHIRLSKPLYRRVASLQHLCRTALAKHVQAPIQRVAGQLPIPNALKNFVKDYPYPQ